MRTYKQCHSDDNIQIEEMPSWLCVKWEEVLDNVDANQDYDTFINKFEELYNDHWKNVRVNIKQILNILG